MPDFGRAQKRVSSPQRVGQPHPRRVVPAVVNLRARGAGACKDSGTSQVITGLDHVQVAAPPGCEAEARAFYGRLLGLGELEKPAALKARGGVWFQVGAQQLHVGVTPDFTPAT